MKENTFSVGDLVSVESEMHTEARVVTEAWESKGVMVLAVRMKSDGSKRIVLVSELSKVSTAPDRFRRVRQQPAPEEKKDLGNA